MKKLLIILWFVPFVSSCQKLVTVRVKKLSHQTARNPSKLIIFGDSFSTNAGVSYPWIVSSDTGIPWTQYAIGCTAVSNTACGAPYNGTSNLVDIYQHTLDSMASAGGYDGSALFSFAFGQNDVSPDATWKTTYQNIIQAFINAGVPRRRIMIMAEPNHSSLAAAHAAARAYVLQIAQALDILYYDVYQRFLNTGFNDTYYSAGDGFVHPNAAGHLIWAAGYETFLVR